MVVLGPEKNWVSTQKNKPLILYVTTHGRVLNQRTLKMLPENIRKQIVLVTQDRTWAEHWLEYQGIVKEVRALPEHVRGLGATRKEVVGWKEEPKIVLMDDDLEFYWRPNPDDWRLRGPGPAEFEQLFAEVEAGLDTYCHVALSGREGNNNYPDYAVESVRYMRFLAYRSDIVDCVEHGRLSGMSDFDVNLQLLKKGYPSLVFYRWAQGHEATQAAGGMDHERTHRKHEWEARQLRYWHSPYVDLVQKRNKTGGEFGTRTEVRVKWKQALQEGIDVYGRNYLDEGNHFGVRGSSSLARDEFDGSSATGGQQERPRPGLEYPGDYSPFEPTAQGLIFPS